ncbi:MAG: hypothetical protein ACE148_15205 [Vicinamibacterales bacterium]
MPSVNPLVADDKDAWFEADSPAWRAACGSFDRAVGGLSRLGFRRTVRTLGLIGRLACRAGLQGPSAREVLRLFPFLSEAAASATARCIGALRLQNRASSALAVGGRLHRLSAALGAVSGGQFLEAATKSRRPSLFVEWHIGAAFGLSAVLHRDRLDALVLRNLPVQSGNDRTRALATAVDCLRAGRPVVVLLDAPGGTATRPVDCLGRRIVFRRGPFMLARVTGAQMHPVVSRWRHDGRLDVAIHEALARPPSLDRDSFEASLAETAARWLQRYLLANPDQIWLFTLRNFLAAPLAAERPPLTPPIPAVS